MSPDHHSQDQAEGRSGGKALGRRRRHHKQGENQERAGYLAHFGHGDR